MIIVKKFGGTSVGSGERMLQVADIIKADTRAKKGKEKHNVIAIVSAVSPAKKVNGTTSLLLKAAELAMQDESFAAQVKQIRENHTGIIEFAIKDPGVRKESVAFIDSELARLQHILKSLTVMGIVNKDSILLDSVICFGEQLSAYLLTQILKSQGVNAVYKDLVQVIPSSVKKVDGSFFDKVQKAIAKACRPKGDETLIVTGYFGALPGGMLNHIGRGYSDFTAALIAAGLGKDKVKELQVWKEVDGICNADPNKVPSAKVLPVISAREASELTYFGSEVLHPFTVSRATAYSIPIRIKNTFAPNQPGTFVAQAMTTIVKPITAITAKKNISIVTIISNRMFNTYGFLAKIFNIMKERQIVVDLISTSEVSVSFSIDSHSKIDEAMADLAKLGEVVVVKQQAILAIIGENIKTSSDVTGRFFDSLGRAKIEVGMISKGEGQVNISCVIDEADIERATAAVFREFFG